MANLLSTTITGSLTTTTYVGVGTASPSVPLTVIADSGGNAVRLLGRSADGYAFTTFRNNADTATNGEIGISNAQNMLFYTGTSERMRITSDGNVLIGTTTDSGYKLKVEGGGRFNGQLQTTQGGRTLSLGDGSYANHINVDSNVDFAFNYNNGNTGGFGFFAGGTTAKFYISNSGNVGIGTTEPSAKPDVNGTGRFSDNVTISSNFPALILSRGGTTFQQDIRFQDSGENIWAIGQAVAAVGNTLDFYSFSYGQVLGLNYTTGAATFSSSVGIGTTSPSNKLTVYQGGGVRVTGITSGDWIEMSGDLPGYSANQYPVIKSNGTIHFANYNKYSAYLEGANTYFGILDSTTTTRVFLATSGNTYFTGGNVGIGTTAPSRKLTIADGTGGGDPTDSRTKLYIDAGTESYISLNVPANSYEGIRMAIAGTNKSTLEYWDNTDAGKKLWIGTIFSDPIVLATTNRERVRITADGNVGIGTTEPSAKLDVIGDIRTSNSILFDTSAATTTSTARIFFGQNISPTGSLDGGQNNFNSFGVDGYGIILQSGYGTADMGGIKITDDGVMVFGAGDENLFTVIDEDSNSVRFSISNIGTSYFSDNVGIGTTAPGAKLEVKPSGDGDIFIGRYSGGSAKLIYAYQSEADGFLELRTGADDIVTKLSGYAGTPSYFLSNVGIGTASPGAKLHLSGAGATELRISSTTSNTNSLLSFYEVSIASWGIDAGQANGKFFIKDLYNTNTRLTIDATGNVGIGTTAPAGKLSVEGDGTEYSNIVFKQSSAQQHLIYASTNFQYNLIGSGTPTWIWGQQGASERMRLNNTGLGIGTTAPDAKLTVVSTEAGSEGLRVDGTSGGFAFVVKAGSDYTSHIRAGATIGVNYFTTPPSNGLIVEGNVGIGTTSPFRKLQVDGATGVRNGSFFLGDETGSTNEGIEFYKSGNILRIYKNGGAFGGNYSAGYVNIDLFSDAAYSTRISGNGASYFNAGNVGIGTTSPIVKLQVGSPASMGSWMSAYFQDGIGCAPTGSRASVYLYSDGNSHFGINAYNYETNVYSPLTVGWGGGNVYIASEGGNVGIGTTTPSLHSGTGLVIAGKSGSGSGRAIMELVETGGARAVFQQVGSGTYIGNLNGNGPLILLVGGTGSSASEAVYISNGGNVGIGTTSPSAKLDVSGNARTSGYVLVNNHSDNTLGYRISNISGSSVSAMFVNSSNQLVIAAGAVDQVNLNKKVYVNGVALGVNVSPSSTAGRIDASNDIVAYSSSDERLKQNITPIANALDKVKSITGVEFDWKPEHKEAHGHEGHDTGIIAQQVQDVMPSAVRTNDTGFLAVRYEKLIGLLIEGMKEQQAQIDELKAKLDGLTK
jgi:hypothetical protein